MAVAAAAAEENTRKKKARQQMMSGREKITEAAGTKSGRAGACRGMMSVGKEHTAPTTKENTGEAATSLRSSSTVEKSRDGGSGSEREERHRESRGRGS